MWYQELIMTIIAIDIVVGVVAAALAMISIGPYSGVDRSVRGMYLQAVLQTQSILIALFHLSRLTSNCCAD